MKKIIILATLLFQVIFAIGQNVKNNWGAWVQSSCFKGLQSRCKINDYNNSTGQYTWDIEIKNNYSSKVSFNFDITNSSIDGRTTINAGGIDKVWTLNPSGTNLYIEFSKTCFDPNDYCSINSNGIQNKGYKCYAECDNGTPNIPNICGDVSSNGQTTTNQPNSSNKQNDLTEYNRSKAEMEEKLRVENERIQRENQENSIKLNIWNNATKDGIEAHNSGNFAEAKNQFTIAINNSTNEQNRQYAQNYYNKSVDAEKNQAKIKMTGELIKVGIEGVYGIADAIKANREIREKREAEKKVRFLEYYKKKQDEKNAKAEAEKLKFEELLIQAENGDFNAQFEIAKKYGKDEEKYRSSLYFYKMAYNNPNRKLSEDFLVEYTDKLQYNRNIVELESIILNAEYTSIYPLIKLKSAFYRIFVNKYFGNYEDFFLQEGITQLKELINQKTDELPSLMYAYMEVTGEYEKFGIALNEKDGLKVLNKTENLLAKFFLGLVYSKGSTSIEKNINKSKELFLDCIGIKIKSAERYGFSIQPYKTNFQYSIFSPNILSHLELAKLYETQKVENGTSLPKIIFEIFPNKNASFVPIEHLNLVSKYLPNLFNMRELNLLGLNNDPNQRFGLPSFPENNSVNLILVNYPINKCSICLDQYKIIKKINGITFLTIQVATEFDITEEQSNDVYYFEGGEKRTEIISGLSTTMTYEKRDKTSNDAILYTNLKEFDVGKLNLKGTLPIIYFYKNNELKKIQTGIADEKTINNIINGIK